MGNTLEIFESIAKDIPRCSKNASKMKLFIEEYAKKEGYEVKTDSFGNILCSKNGADVCLQSHYDMVCVGEYENITLKIENGWLKAANSSLGADNGIGVAMMLSMMDSFLDVEFLFTADEEVGLIGAKNIELNIESTKVINLDSEEEGAIYVACAGGVDFRAFRGFESVEADGDFYEISIDGLPGGHSGVDIDKNIPNAIIELAKALRGIDAKVGYFEGGEKKNSIPVSARAIVSVETEPKLDGFCVKKAEPMLVLAESDVFLDAVINSGHGPDGFDYELGVVEKSLNTAKVALKDGKCDILLSGRAMKKTKLDDIESSVVSFFARRSFCTEVLDRYEAWEWEEGDFAVFAKGVFKRYFYNSNFKAIHAGLECAALKQKFPNASFVSVGPNIEYPHSINERVEIESVQKTYEAVFELVRAICR